MAAAEAGQGTLDLEYRIIRPDGSLRWLHGQGEVIFGVDGSPLRIAGVVQDVTERRQMEEALAGERSLLRTFIDTVPDLLYAKDRASRFVLVNQALARQLGAASTASVVGKSDDDFFSRRTRRRLSRRRRACACDRRAPASSMRSRLALQESDDRWWYASTKVPWRNTDGEVIGLVGVGRDITLRKQIEQRLGERERLLQAVADALSHRAGSTTLHDVGRCGAAGLGAGARGRPPCHL